MIAFLSLLISDLVGWDPTMHSDGLVSKESLRADTVGAMVTRAVVLGAVDGACCGGRWRSYGWCFWVSQWRRVGVLVGASVGPIASVVHVVVVVVVV